MPGRPCSGRCEAGHVVLVALLAILLLSTALAVAAAGLLIRLREARKEAADVRATALADAALAHALAHLAGDPGFRGLPEEPLGGGTIESDLAFHSAERATVRVRATWAGARREVLAGVVMTVDGPIVVSWRRVR